MDRKYVDWLLDSDNVEARCWAVLCKLDLDASMKDGSGEVQAAAMNVQGLVGSAPQNISDDPILKPRKQYRRPRLMYHADAMDFEPVLADILSPRPDSCFVSRDNAPYELLFHAIALYLNCEARPSQRTLSNAMKLFFVETFPTRMTIIGVEEYNRSHGEDICSSKYHSPLEIIFEDLEKKEPGHIAVRFFRAYRELLREQFVRLVDDCDAAVLD